MKYAIISEVQIKDIEDALSKRTSAVGSENECQELKALAIIQSLKPTEHVSFQAALNEAVLHYQEKIKIFNNDEVKP